MRRGYELLGDYAATTGIPVERTGALLVAWTPDELDALPGLQAKAAAQRLRRLRDRRRRRGVPAGPGARPRRARRPDGARTSRSSAPGRPPSPSPPRPGRAGPSCCSTAGDRRRVVRHHGDGVTVTMLPPAAATSTPAGWSTPPAWACDLIDGMFGHDRFTVTPRRGELLVFDKLARPLVDRIVLPVPSKLGKGVLISPDRSTATSCSARPRKTWLTAPPPARPRPASTSCSPRAGQLLPRLLEEEVTASYAGLRAADRPRRLPDRGRR